MEGWAERFDGAAQRAFAYLETDFGCRASCERGPQHGGAWTQWVWHNGRTAVRLFADARERHYLVSVARVHDDAVAADDEAPLWAVLRARGVPDPGHSRLDDALDTGLAAWAAALRDHAGDVLHGEHGALDAAHRLIETIAAREAAHDEERRASGRASS